MNKVLRYSKHREDVFNLLKSVTSHPTAEWIYTQLKETDSSISLATVYRNLNQLYELGSVIRIDAGDGIVHYDATVRDHCHFICESCGTVSDIDVPSSPLLKAEAEKLNSIKVSKTNLVFFGLCQKCQKDLKSLNIN